MSLAVLASRAVFGMRVCPVQVEVHVSRGLPAFTVVGLPGVGVRESRDRVRSAILNSGFDYPAGRITVNLAPADLPKDSGRFDLPIALGVLLASGQVVDDKGGVPDVRGVVLAGELSLTGILAPAHAALAIALAVARDEPCGELILAPPSATLAARVPGLRVCAARSLADVVNHVNRRRVLPVVSPTPPVSVAPAQSLCLSDVRGQLAARHALEVAAAGAHSLLMCGPPGVGKSLLAQRLPGLLPPLSEDQRLAVAAIHSLVEPIETLPVSPPFRAPHHGATLAALVGGGPRPRPGEISLAHEGVLFLDELPEFERRTLEALREPLEAGRVTIARASGSARFPARFQLIAAMNPCPCGFHGHPRQVCRCTPGAIARYRARLSGPLLDRIDLHVTLQVEPSWLEAPAGEASAVVRKRVAAARARQWARQGCLNAQLDADEVQRWARPGPAARSLLTRAVERWGGSARSIHRILRVGRTLADLADQPAVELTHIAQALQFRPEPR